MSQPENSYKANTGPFIELTSFVFCVWGVTVLCSVSWKSLFHIFCPVLFCLMQKGKSSHRNFRLVRSEILMAFLFLPFYYLYHSIEILISFSMWFTFSITSFGTLITAILKFRPVPSPGMLLSSTPVDHETHRFIFLVSSNVSLFLSYNEHFTWKSTRETSK